LELNVLSNLIAGYALYHIKHKKVFQNFYDEVKSQIKSNCVSDIFHNRHYAYFIVGLDVYYDKHSVVKKRFPLESTLYTYEYPWMHFMIHKDETLIPYQYECGNNSKRSDYGICEYDEMLPAAINFAFENNLLKGQLDNGA